jgi:hypothetical protein
MRVTTSIPAHLSYASRYWADRLEATPNQSENLEIFLPLVKNLFRVAFLYWLEVLSMLKLVALAQPSIAATIEWISV